MTTLYLIVARGGSKRLPSKNMRKIAGISLTGYKCLAAQVSKSCSEVMISTDSPEIAEEARQYGVLVPFIRPDELATETATTEDVVRHVIDWYEDEPRRKTFHAIHLLEPSSPFVRPSDYDAACAMMTPDVQFVCGDVLYLFCWDYLKTRKDLYDDPIGKVTYHLPANQAVDIDDYYQFRHAEWLVEHGYVDLSWAKK